MSRYFKYKHADDLLTDSRALGRDVRLDSDLAPLLTPVRIGGRTVGNRLAIQPMEGCDSEADGSPSELTYRRYQRFGAGGAKLIWGEACAVVPEGRANPRQLVINESTAPALERLLRDCRAAHREAMGRDDDLLVGLQLTHSGRYSYARPILAQHDPLLDPRTIMDRATGATASADTPLISDDELDHLQDAFVTAAGLAFRIGFDFVDLKQCHRYLLNELLAARGRVGKYGGSFENRTRFILELSARLRADFPRSILASRMNIFDGVPYQKGPDGTGIPVTLDSDASSCWGTSASDPLEADLVEPKTLIGLLKAAGLDLLNVSMGNPYASPHLVRPFEYPPPDGYETPEHPLVGVDRHFRLTAELQRAHPDVPIVGSGYSWLQAFALQAGAANVRDGMATFVGIGRGSLSQPDFGRKAIEGKPLEPKKICRTFSYCTALMRSKHNAMGQFPTGCPPFDKEVYGPIWDEAKEPGKG